MAASKMSLTDYGDDIADLSSRFGSQSIHSNKSSIITSKSLECTFVTPQREVLTIPATVHEQLASSGGRIVEELKKTNVKKDSSGDPSPNLLMVNIGFKLSKPTKRGRTFVSLPIQVDADEYYSIKNSLRNESEPEENSARRINWRHAMGKGHSPQSTNFTKTQRIGPFCYYQNDKRTYYDKWHHSEQALFEYLTSERRRIVDLVKDLTDLGLQPDTEVYSVEIDMHSTRYVCKNCELGMQGMMTPEYIFLKMLKSEFEEAGLTFNLQSSEISHRISADKPYGSKANLTESAHNKSSAFRTLGAMRSAEERNRSIFQADTRISKPEAVLSDLNSRTVFASSDIGENSTYLGVYRAIAMDEISQYIAQGTRRARHHSLMNDSFVSQSSPDIIAAFEVLEAIGHTTIDKKKAAKVYQQRQKFKKDVQRHVRWAQLILTQYGFKREYVTALGTAELCRINGRDLIHFDMAEVKTVVADSLVDLDDFLKMLKSTAVKQLLSKPDINLRQLLTFRFVEDEHFYDSLLSLYQHDHALFTQCFTAFLAVDLIEDSNYFLLNGVSLAMHANNLSFDDLVDICRVNPNDLQFVCGSIEQNLRNGLPNLSTSVLNLAERMGVDVTQFHRESRTTINLPSDSRYQVRLTHDIIESHYSFKPGS